jgi:hypothetical protein
MKKRYARSVLAALLVSGFVGACASAEPIAERQVPPIEIDPIPTPEFSPIPPPEETSKVTIPDIIGRKVGKARSILENRGFFVLVRKKKSDETPGTVLSVSPKPGNKLELGDLVRITVAKPAPVPKPAPAAAAACHPSYEGACLDPNVSDYDCAGGPGNGPGYTGFVAVVGPDVFELDGDGDGAGCE